MSSTSTRYYRKRQSLWALINKMKLWPSRSGVLHGILSIQPQGAVAVITTHCGEKFTTRDSRNSRAARWLRSKQYVSVCRGCRVPDWKVEKFGSTIFSKRHGAILKKDFNAAQPQP